MPCYVLSGVGLFAFATLSCFHLWNLWSVASYHLPKLAILFAALLVLVWLTSLGLILYAIKQNKLKECLLLVFLYMMAIILAGTRVLDGVPGEVGTTKWRDPQHRLTAGDKYLLHNHGNVTRALSEGEYELYLSYVNCYFSAAFMLLAAVLCLYPLDRDGQLNSRRRIVSGFAKPRLVATAQCRDCSCLISASVSGELPPWCPNCGADL
jgi:hypothetical protein